MQLRPYQQRTVGDLFTWWTVNTAAADIPILSLPTAAGKSVICAEIVRMMYAQWPEHQPRTVVLVPSKELAEQNADKLVRLLPANIRVGFVSASLGKKQFDADVIVATIGSIAKSAHLLGNIKAVIIDECFTGDTLISTLNGNVRIDSISAGDTVLNATCSGIVEAISKKETTSICIVRLSNGTEIRTTDNHPFFTTSGWKNAKNLAQGEGIICLQDMPELWRGISSLGCDSREWTGCDPISRNFRESKVLLNILRQEIGECDVGSWGEGEDVSDAKENWSQAFATWWERERADITSENNTFDFVEWMDCGISNQDWGNARIQDVSDMLQSGHRKPNNENCNRTGRAVSLREKEDSGREERCFPRFTWVESVTHQELSSSESVFNLQVGGHPSYFANGALVHNCHLVSNKGSEVGMYRKFLQSLGRICHFRTVGMTATAFRGNGIWLTDGNEPLFTGVASNVTMREMLDAGFISPLVPPAGPLATRIDASGVGIVNGDYKVGDLSEVVDDYLEDVAAESAKLATNRAKWIAFTPSVANAETLATKLHQHGIESAVVCGETPKADRERLIAQFRRGELRCLVTVLALSVGFDVPDVDCIVWCRPTKSPVLYVQGMGRGVRIHPGKVDCLVLDFTDTVERMGPVDTIKGKAMKGGGGDAPYCICPECGERNHAAALDCIHCGAHIKDPEPPVLDATASRAALLSSQVIKVPEPIVWHDVERVEYAVHKKEGKPDSLRVDYFGDIFKIGSEWVCFEHGGYARAKAEKWWDRRNKFASVMPVPDDTNTAYLLSRDPAEDWLNEPTRIATRENGKFTQIVDYDFEPKRETT